MGKDNTQISIHSARNLLGETSQLDLFSSQVESFSEEYNTPITGKIDRFGIDLTDIQSRVMEGILRGFSESKYSQKLETREREQFCQEKFSGKIPPAYKHIKEIPCLKTSQTQIISWAGIKKNSIGAWGRAVDAIDELGSKQFCFYYSRLAYDPNGQPLRDKNGRWVKEEVYTVDTLFTIKKIEKNGKLEYYEIYPSSIFLDQLDSYFMLIPFNWREEVCELVGQKKASSYTFRFLFFLRYQYELLRRRSKEKPFILRKSPEEICIFLKMPESIYKRKTKRANAILLDAYEVAKKLGYIESYERREVDIFVLNDQKYLDPKNIPIQIEKEEPIEISSELQCLEAFQRLRMEFDPNHKEPSPNEKKTHLRAFKQLLEQRSQADIEKVLKWSIHRKFWCSYVTTPLDFIRNFDKIWADMTTKSDESKEEIANKNKKKAHAILDKYENIKINGALTVSVLNKYVEITNGPTSTCIYYEDVDFNTKLNEALKKWKII